MLTLKILRILGLTTLALVLVGVIAWIAGALFYDGPGAWLAIIHGIASVVVLFFFKPRKLGLGIFALWFVAVLGWWLNLRPTNDADWQPAVAQLARAEINGDIVTLHNVRNCEYRTEHDFTPRWETRTVDISKITGIDMAVNYWGSPYMAHPIVSFQFEDAPPICFSIETRRMEGQNYSAIGGLYRQYSLIYLVADERDILRVRTNFRKGEDVYLYRLTSTPEQAQERFLEYLQSINKLTETPRWYNAINTNCTTAIRHQHHGERQVWDWRILVNGKMDELMYDRGIFKTDGLPFEELKRRAHANADALAAGDSPDFSQQIRAGRPGMGPAISTPPLDPPHPQ